MSPSGPLEKLGRGVANIAFGPLELLIRPWDVAQDKGNVAALTYGVFKGVAFTVARVVVGTVDIITFPMPLPGCTDDPKDVGWGYGPMMRPAWVVDMDHNAYNFFYKDEALAETY
ncbi:MAG: exosortase system-associated protein, TIGR04073 family [Lentisphaerae bacterium]|nr:exosortase system-associated protein, TIGR04073 family [Lentisphaerota bacterium]MCP4100260.1 exosortase system-associated protein, TIGR04073 family [Lentisphaerota bacterium]